MIFLLTLVEITSDLNMAKVIFIEFELDILPVRPRNNVDMDLMFYLFEKTYCTHLKNGLCLSFYVCK